MRKIALFALITFNAGSALADSYNIDPNHTLPVFEVNHLGFTTQRGRFDKTSGKIQLDREKKTGAVDWTIEADSIDMGQTKWNDHLKSADFFNVAQFPAITYHSERFRCVSFWRAGLGRRQAQLGCQGIELFGSG